MLMNVYSIFDKCSGIYSEPFCAINDDVAKRRFKQICLSSSVVAPDLQLYKLGEFESSTGELFLTKNLKPVFLEGGVANGKA